MNFEYTKSIQLLERTPKVLYALLANLSEDWTLNKEGENTWSVFDVLGHLIYCDKHNWLTRITHLIREEDKVAFPAFDRFAQNELYKDQMLDQLLPLFIATREEVLQHIRSLRLQEHDFNRKGLHPDFGEVTLAQLFAAWVVHDLSHLSQIARVMAKHYQAEVGPWINYLRILQT